MTYLLAVPLITLLAILVIVAFYLLADFVSRQLGVDFTEKPNGSGK
jgi:hypothetical protein